MTNASSSTTRTTSASYRQQKLKSKQIDNQLYGNLSAQLVSTNNNQLQLEQLQKTTRPLRILLMGPRNCGIKTFLMNALDMEADDFMIRTMLSMSHRVNQISNSNLAGLDDTELTRPLTFQQKAEGLFSEKNRNLTLNVYMYICRGIKVFVKWEWKYFERLKRKIHENYEHHHYHEEHFDLVYNWEGDEDGKLLDELINDCREQKQLNSKIISIYSKIVNYGKKEVMNEFYNSLLRSTNIRYLDNIQ
ncbi:predicted protein [Naegleria gruberi]|uniref:Predicted protein n=1 Tax=Naegleria gruberi TaxID=5762 RepID=D2VJM7_NAEGR|nr:uncharacterized protein NAEGRDRAFT_50090 [Naegleria gruberi]EFC42980.1 predicted protein [Naegleria gruberi]|eukprot:XP_002675724.1 predicted protein [Naegleria gruberi strain NEG-M]